MPNSTSSLLGTWKKKDVNQKIAVLKLMIYNLKQIDIDKGESHM